MDGTSQAQLEKLRFPIGRFENPEEITSEMLNGFISEIEDFPSKLRNACENLSDEKLDTRYRPNGWTVRQVIHHCADSHMNAFVRVKLALTEDKPVIKPYFEALWAELPDSRKIPVEAALKMLEGIHERWTTLLKSLGDADFEKGYIHPEHGKEVTIKKMTALYSWHCNHHLGHVNIVARQ